MAHLRALGRLLLLSLVVGLVALSPAVAFAAFAPPPMRDAVTDTAGKLTDADDRALEERITAYRNRTGNELAVLVVASLAGETIEDVAYRTFNTWHIGKKDLDNGVLLVIAPNERRTRIETGKGIGDKLTDIDCAIILRERVGPLLKQDRFREAIEAALGSIEAALDGKPPPPLPASLVAAPLVAGAFIDDQAGALDAATLAALEGEAAQQARYWRRFAILVVRDEQLSAPDKVNLVPLYERRKTVDVLRDYTPIYLLVGASRRRVVAVTSTVEQWNRKAEVQRRLDAIAREAATLESAIRAIAAAEVASAIAFEAKQLETERAAALKKKADDRSNLILFIGVMTTGILVVVVFPIWIMIRRRRRGGGGGYEGAWSTADTSYSSSSYSSSYDYSSSSSSDSSSVDTSYSGGGGSSGGGGASDSY